ncbi:MAG: 1-aminocyclopropane-1-carboxylate deaminase/D-cysteine desulfhydrase [Sulfurovaceae bacterium]|nr:1-aminocyclopropane-1-carboxylate deaminase/D-cysteine desulfhydrase [Sulfurovaceae bacterium]
MQDLKLFLPTPIENISLDGHNFYLKRDDLIHPDFSGNKARKLYYFLINDFPNISKIISYGSAQSNAMYSLSVLANIKGWEFEYIVDHIADFLRENPHGNYAKALANGMKLIVNNEYVSNNTQSHDNGILFIEEGGRQKEAGYGLETMAKEIIDWQITNNVQKLNIFLPSGTGTTALFLQKHCYLLNAEVKTIIHTTPCVGNSDYLKEQFFMLESDERLHPTILEPQKKWHFSKLYREHYKIWLKLHQQTGIEFDMLYDPIGWQVLLANMDKLDGEIMYIHQGGVLGNESMLPRYQRKYKDMV